MPRGAVYAELIASSIMVARCLRLLYHEHSETGLTCTIVRIIIKYCGEGGGGISVQLVCNLFLADSVSMAFVALAFSRRRFSDGTQEIHKCDAMKNN